MPATFSLVYDHQQKAKTHGLQLTAGTQPVLTSRVVDVLEV